MRGVVILIFCLFSGSVMFGMPLVSDSLFHRLNESIANRPFYLEQKNDTLIVLKNRLLNATSLEQKYDVAKQLVYEYSSYENKSTLSYADQCLEIARQVGDQTLINEALLSRANYLRFSGLTYESLSILKAIDPAKLPVELQKTYYRVYMDVCHSYVKLQNDSFYRDQYIELALRNADSYLSLERGDEPKYLSVQAYKFYLEKNYLQAVNTIKTLQKRNDVTPLMRAEYLYYLGLIYLELGDDYNEISFEAFIRSAIICNEHAITNLLSSMYVGKLLINSDDPHIEMADEYVNASFENAAIFGDKYMLGFISSTYYYILQINLERAEADRRTLTLIIMVVSSFLVMLGGGLLLLLRNNRKLKNIREELSESNARLQNFGLVKEAYIKFFLRQNLSYIEKTEKHKYQLLSMLNKDMPREKIKSKIDSLFNESDDANSLLSDFDRLISELFPCFVDQVNKLLKPDHLYMVDKNSQQKLNTELRILAFIKLGVVDNKEIASFFRITLQSVYNYRSKARSKAVNENSFDEDIMNLVN